MTKRTWTKRVRPLIEMGDHVGIELSDGSVALIDNSDRPLVEGWNWTAKKCRSGSVYAVRGLGRDRVSLHVLIAGYHNPDHRNGNTLDNRRQNLRHATAYENAHNRSLARSNTSGFKGVTYRADRGTWLATITHHGEVKKLGTFPTAELAAKRYDREARVLFGEHAALNFPDAGERGARKSAVSQFDAATAA